MSQGSDIVTAKFIVGMMGLIISGFVVAHGLATGNLSILDKGLVFANGIVMFFLGRSTARPDGNRPS